MIGLLPQKNNGKQHIDDSKILAKLSEFQFPTIRFYFGANSLSSQGFFQTGWFVEGLITQTLIIHMIRTPKIPFIKENAALPLILSTICIAIIVIWLPFGLLASHIGMVALPFKYFIFLGLVMIGYWTLMSALKYWYIKRFKAWLQIYKI